MVKPECFIVVCGLLMGSTGVLMSDFDLMAVPIEQIDASTVPWIAGACTQGKPALNPVCTGSAARTCPYVSGSYSCSSYHCGYDCEVQNLVKRPSTAEFVVETSRNCSPVSVHTCTDSWFLTACDCDPLGATVPCSGTWGEVDEDDCS